MHKRSRWNGNIWNLLTIPISNLKFIQMCGCLEKTRIQRKTEVSIPYYATEIAFILHYFQTFANHRWSIVNSVRILWYDALVKFSCFQNCVNKYHNFILIHIKSSGGISKNCVGLFPTTSSNNNQSYNPEEEMLWIWCLSLRSYKFVKSIIQ